MAKEKRTDAVWVEIDPASLNPEQKLAYETYKDAYRVMKQNRQEFEAMMSRAVPQGQRMIFGYNFGKLSVAVVADERKETKARTPKLSLADYLANMTRLGVQT